MSNEFKTVSDAEAIAWAERNDFQGSFVDLRAAIEDAQSIGTPHTAPPRVVIDTARLAEIIQNNTGCADTDSVYAAIAVQTEMELTK